MLAPASRADSGDFRVGGAAAGASVCVSVFFEKPNEVAWRRAREPARQTSVTTCAALPGRHQELGPLRGNLHHFAAVAKNDVAQRRRGLCAAARAHHADAGERGGAHARRDRAPRGGSWAAA